MHHSKSKKAPGSAGRAAVRPAADTVARELKHLETLGVEALRDLWARRFRTTPPVIRSGDVLRRLIAWKIQIEAFGDLDAKTYARIRALMRTGRSGATVAVATTVTLKAGSILVREWRGVEHRVLILDQGFEHRDKRYKSLTAVARAITGTKWSGPRFFGLELGQASSRGGDKP
jgi:Protein of unknown function (DUF2924)